jgi:hypothetical protein
MPADGRKTCRHGDAERADCQQLVSLVSGLRASSSMPATKLGGGN